jgi:hypothetical protein
LFSEQINQDYQLLIFLFDTDGVRSSVHIFKWKSVRNYDKTPKQREDRLQNARDATQEVIFASICAGAEEMDVKWV